MSDPLSIAGSAVGIISLGLQVCGEIVSYCQSWRGFDDDIQRITEKADALRMPLKQLRELIEDTQRTNPADASDLEEKTQSLQQAIMRLKAARDRYSSTSSVSPNGFRYQVKKAKYPFKKDGLREMCGDLDSIQLVLQTTLQIASVRSARSLLVMQETVIQEIRDMNSKLMGQPLQSIPPSLLQQLCDQKGRISVTQSDLSQGLTCTSLETTRVSSPSSSSYGTRSRLSSKAKLKTSIKSYRYSMPLLGLIVQASFSFTKGAGGFSIAPCLYVQPLVSAGNSVGYWICRDLLDNAIWSDEIANEAEQLITMTIEQFQNAFDQQQASPNDTFEYGNSVWRVLCWASEELSEDSLMFIHLDRILTFLLDCGCRPDNFDDQGRRTFTALERHTAFEQEDSLSSRLLELGCIFTLQTPHSLTGKRELRCLISRGDDSITVPDIARMIIEESEDELREVIQSGAVSPNYGVPEYYSLLGLSFGWPQGIQILLEAGADACVERIWFLEDNPQGDTYRSVKLMLEAGCPFQMWEIRECEKLKDGSRIRTLFICEWANRIRKLWDLARIHLPLRRLPKLIAYETAADTSFIFDAHVQETRAILMAQGVVIDAKMTTPESWGYSSWSPDAAFCYPFSTETLEELYRHGFRGMNEMTNRVTPLHSVAAEKVGDPKDHLTPEMERMAWLISKGADPHQKPPGSSASTAHHVGVNIVDTILFGVYYDQKRTRRAKVHRIWEMGVSRFGKGCFLLPSSADGCKCACAPNGCTTISVVLRHIFQDFNNFTLGFTTGSTRSLVRGLVQFVITWSENTSEVHQGVIRFLTFNALDLNHTCCIKITNYKGFLQRLESREAAEIEEIIDEQKLGLIALEKLVMDFQAKFNELALPVMEFLDGYWYTHMVEFLRQRDPYDEDHFNGSRNIGVDLRPEKPFRPDGMLLLFGPHINRVIDVSSEDGGKDGSENGSEDVLGELQ